MNLAAYRITINPTGMSGSAANIYTSKVREHLTWIYRTHSGRLLLRSIRFYKRPITITPYTGGDCNSIGGATAIGGDGIVNYSPNTFSLHGACPANTTVNNRGLLWDEILFHELVHVFRAVSGKWNKSNLSPALRHYTDREEFYAVLIANIYISDRSNKIKTGLRANHATFDPLSEDFDDSFEFFSSGMQVFGLIESFCNDHPFFARSIASTLIDAAFNPLADFYADRERARLASQNALKREIAGIIEQMREIAAKAIGT